ATYTPRQQIIKTTMMAITYVLSCIALLYDCGRLIPMLRANRRPPRPISLNREQSYHARKKKSI
ncbi:MAG: hypothetical protein N2559_07590, partial [Anaerolineae bacterium]|nr:hypothetical protein [Anaerolineae bacterium]